MQISIIVAMAENNIIGLDNKMPWHLPGDLQHFKKITLYKPIIMGRKTFESIGKALPKRRNIIISQNKNYHVHNCEIYASLDLALKSVAHEPEVMIIGGESIYKEALKIANTIYLTLIAAKLKGDTFFPQIDYKIWREVARESHSADDKNNFDYSFVTLKRS